VREQGTATTEIARLIAATETMARAVAGRIAEVSSEAQSTGAQAGSVRSGAEDLARTVAGMQQTVLAALATSGDRAAA